MSALDAANWERYYPRDLITNPTPANLAANAASDKNNFTVVVPNLKIDASYAFQFQYVFEDGVKSDWSPGYFLNTPTESVPSAPTATVSGGAGFIQVSLPTFPANASRVDVRIAGGIFGDGTKVASSFTSAGTRTITAPGSAAPGLAYVVTLLTVTPSKINGDPSTPTTVYVTDPTANIQSPENSVTPSIPTVSSVLGAIQVAWNGKTSTGGNQPYGFDAAKVYVGTTAEFIPSSSNQVDVLNFANGQNVLNIGVGTLVNGVALTYGTDYYVKIATTNGTDTSTAVSASGNPVRVGQVTSGDIVTIRADKIETGTLSAGSKITAGAPGGKRVELSGTGDTPFAIYGTGGTKIFDYNSTSDKLTIVGDGTFSGNLSAAGGTFSGNISGASGTFTGNLSASNGLFSVNNGVLTAQTGTIGGWTITGSTLESSSSSNSQIRLTPVTANGGKIALLQNGVERITIDPVEGIKDSVGNFTLTPSGNLIVRGTITSGSTITGADITMTGNAGQNGVGATKLLFQASNYAISAGTSSFTYGGTSGGYNTDGDWVGATDPQTITSNDIRFTDATYGGAIPYNTDFYYGEMWLGSGNSLSGKAGSIDLWVNHPNGYMGISIIADAAEKNINIFGDPSAGFGTLHRNSTSDEFRESPAFLQVDSAGRLSRGRAVITGGSSSPNNVLGLTGDLYFSTAV